MSLKDCFKVLQGSDPSKCIGVTVRPLCFLLLAKIMEHFYMNFREKYNPKIAMFLDKR